MKKVLVSVVALFTVCAFGLSAQAGVIDDKCVKCHKAEKAVDKIAAKGNIKDGEGMLKAVRGGSKAGLHKNLTDEEIKASAAELKAPAK
ncbi:MAG TPA: hypothetical protein VLH56_06115 [Dissulfurispiraceae bacterium]|nr:hypothetical protein [Dissulfurispiraceae bacterium]